jgi:hypothetical protein
MITLLSLVLAAQSVPVPTPDLTASLIELFRRSDEYRQCLILDKSLASEPRDTFFAEGGTSAENLDFLLSDRQDRLLKRLIEQGKGKSIIDAIQLVRFAQVDEDRCRDFDPYYGPALNALEELERIAGLERAGGQIRFRRQHSRR